MSDLRSQIKILSPAEKAELLDTVWESLKGDSASLTDAQRAELDYCIARHEQNPSDVIPWQEVRAGLRNRDPSSRPGPRGGGTCQMDGSISILKSPLRFLDAA
jgi:putative addiction module component (TIGR02574 family)